jgi:hypothetical protein
MTPDGMGFICRADPLALKISRLFYSGFTECSSDFHPSVTIPHFITKKIG